MHIVDNLAPGLLLGMDIITPEKISLDVARAHLTLHRHNNMKVNVVLTAPEKPKVPRVRAKQRAVIAAHSVSMVPVGVVRPDDTPLVDNAIFVPQYNNATQRLEQLGGFYTQALELDDSGTRIAVRNDSDVDFVIPRHTYVGFVEAFDEREAYAANFTMDHALARFDHQLDNGNTLPPALRLSSDLSPFSDDEIPLRQDVDLSKCTDWNGVTVYVQDAEQRARIVAVLEKHT